MLSVTKLRDLTVDNTSEGRPDHLSAGSGIVRRGEFIYVIGDDELGLSVFRLDDDASRPGRLYRLFEGELPLDHDARKAQKPDLEAITTLPPFEFNPHGALLALGSGSKETRSRGFVWSLDGEGGLQGFPREVDLSDLYSFLKRHVAELNIEGAAVQGDRLALFQRGNSELGHNMIVHLDIDEVIHTLITEFKITTEDLVDIDKYDLGKVNGVELSFTDGDSFPGGYMVFSAAAEDTDNPYADGEVVGSAVGVIDPDGKVMAVEPLEDPSIKVEGVDAVPVDDGMELLLVADADDVAIPSPLLKATMPLP